MTNVRGRLEVGRRLLSHLMEVSTSQGLLQMLPDRFSLLRSPTLIPLLRIEGPFVASLRCGVT
jgi:hypothetical protein